MIVVALAGEHASSQVSNRNGREDSAFASSWTPRAKASPVSTLTRCI